MVIHVSGMPRISSFLAPAAASDANVPTGVIGDGPGHSVGNDATTSADVDNAVAPPTCLVSSS